MPNFNFTYAPGTTLQQMVGMEMAGRIWSSYLKDPVTVNIHVGVISSSLLPKNIIGGAIPGVLAQQKLTDVRDRLLIEAGDRSYSKALAGTSDGRSFDDKVAASNLVFDTNLNTWLDAKIQGIGIGYVNSNLISTSTLNVTRANAKALGLNLPNADNLDGYILLSDLAGSRTSTGESIGWNYNYTGAVASNQLDFLSTAVHEIGHILGFVSGVDRPGWMFNTVDMFNETPFWNNGKEQVKNATPLDLFRWDKSGSNDISYGTLDANSTNSGRYFSIDDGNTNLANFSTGSDITRGGDGGQASHWKQGVSGLMGPKLRLGTRVNVSAVDLRAFDAIGWDLQTTTALSSAPSLSIWASQEQKMVERGGLNATALANLTIDLSSLQSSAISSLATRAGQTTAWINSNLTNYGAMLPTSLQRDRSLDVAIMIVQSQVYEWGQKKGDTAWQTMLNLFHSEGLFSSTDELEFSPNFQTATLEMISNPESGIWTFGLQNGRSGLNSTESGSMEISSDSSVETNFINAGVSGIKTFGMPKQSRLDRGSRAWDSKGKKIAEKWIPETESLEFTQQPRKLTIE